MVKAPIVVNEPCFAALTVPSRKHFGLQKVLEGRELRPFRIGNLLLYLAELRPQNQQRHVHGPKRLFTFRQVQACSNFITTARIRSFRLVTFGPVCNEISLDSHAHSGSAATP